MIHRLLRAVRLESAFYEEVEHNPAFTGEAFLVVVLASVAAALGMALAYPGDSGFPAIALNVLFAVMSWVAWAAITLWIGKTVTRGPETKSDMGEMLRVLGYAHAPLLLLLLLFIPRLGSLLALAASLWTIAAGVVAIRQALDFTTARAVITGILGFVVIQALRFLVRLVV